MSDISDISGPNDVEVEMINKSTDLTGVSNDLVQARYVGLAVMGPTVGSDTKPSAIILTTAYILYVIDPDDTRGIMFLKAKLIDKRIHYYLSDGFNEAASLYGNYNIDLNAANINADCCTGLHIHLMNMLKHAPMYTMLRFPPAVQRVVRKQPSIEPFDNLAEIWLGINKDCICYDSSQLSHLRTRPLDMIAIDIIKKRCILIRSLARILVDYSWLEMRQMSDSLFTSLTNCNSLIRREKVKQLLDREENGKCDIELMAHLNSSIDVE